MIEIGTIQKNCREEIRFTLDMFKRHEVVNARVWYRDDAGEYSTPRQNAKKGASVRFCQGVG